MTVEIEKAHNGEETCSVNNIKLHSSYNPGKEAKNFVSNLEVNFNVQNIIITEPALSHSLPYLKERFPSSKIICIRYSNIFDNYNKGFDKVFYANNNFLSEQIFSYLGEEGIAKSLFVSWTSSQNAFPQEYEHTWNEIKKLVIKSRNVLATRNYFSKRWIKNSLRFVAFTKKSAKLKKSKKNILICASGKSLESSINKIKENRNKFILISVSSALSVLLHNEIIPDLCISTDGGYYAKRHIPLSLNKYNIPLALSSESNVYSKILEENTIIPLTYNDSPSDEVLYNMIENLTPASRNGTVSGTAVNFALNLTDGNIFVCGLDLDSNKSFSHTQPNYLEIDDSLKDNRFKPKETRLFPSTLKNPALEIYKNWFSNQNFYNRVFRLSNNYSFSNTLGSIEDVNWDFFEANINSDDEKNKNDIIESSNFYNSSFDYKIKQIKNILSKRFYSKEWMKNSIPNQIIMFEKQKGFPLENEAKLNIEKSLDEVKNSINRTFGDKIDLL